MKNYTTNKRYCPHEITTKLHSVQLYRQTRDISYVCRKYKVSKASLMRWNKAYDGTKESLMSKSHRPHTPHPNAHTEQEIKRTAALSAAKLRPMMAKRSKLSHKRRIFDRGHGFGASGDIEAADTGRKSLRKAGTDFGHRFKIPVRWQGFFYLGIH